MIEQSIAKLLEDAAKKVKAQKEPKVQPINGNYRNCLYYENLFKDMDMDEAYTAIVKNLKSPSFSHEAENAIQVYEKKYGIFQSKEERKQIAIEEENAQLRKKIAELEAAKANTPTTDENDKTIDPGDFPNGMDKEQFKVFFTEWYAKSQGHAPDPMTIGRAYKKYNKNETQV